MISICICTYNRSESLRRTLASLAEHVNAESGAIELIIIDNNCIDDTHLDVKACGQRLPIRRITESRQGLAHARNRAIRESRGDAILFTDDDVSFARCWLDSYQDAIHRFPGADYFGGRILPDWGMRNQDGLGTSHCHCHCH